MPEGQEVSAARVAPAALAAIPSFTSTDRGSRLLLEQLAVRVVVVGLVAAEGRLAQQAAATAATVPPDQRALPERQPQRRPP